MIVVDSDVLIDYLRGDERAYTLLEEALSNEKRLMASVLTKVEILAGIPKGQESATQNVLSLIEWIPTDENIANNAGELARQYLKSHSGVSTSDYVIAATASIIGADLWTRNIKHFPMFPQLRPPY